MVINKGAEKQVKRSFSGPSIETTNVYIRVLYMKKNRTLKPTITLLEILYCLVGLKDLDVGYWYRIIST
jgi:hypothetical protein